LAKRLPAGLALESLSDLGQDARQGGHFSAVCILMPRPFLKVIYAKNYLYNNHL
jgi:hypothetical protein